MSENDVLSLFSSTLPPHTGGLSTGLIAGIVVVCAVILLTFLAGCGVGVIVHVVYRKNSKQSKSVLLCVCVCVCMCVCVCVYVHLYI